MSNADDSLVADVASELEERLALETGGIAAVECKCEAVGVDSENRYLECTYEVRECSGGLKKASEEDKTGLCGGVRNNVMENNQNGKVDAARQWATATPVAVELLRKQHQNRKQQGVMAVKVP